MEKLKLQTCSIRDTYQLYTHDELIAQGKILHCLYEDELVFITNEDLDNNIDIQCPVCRKHYFEGRKII
jgi:hypothetical protein